MNIIPCLSASWIHSSVNYLFIAFLFLTALLFFQKNPCTSTPSLMNKVPLTVNWLWPHSDRDSIEKHLGSSEVIPEDPVDMQGSSPCLLSADPYCDPAPNRGYAGSKAVVRCSDTELQWMIVEWKNNNKNKSKRKTLNANSPLFFLRLSQAAIGWVTFHLGK